MLTISALGYSQSQNWWRVNGNTPSTSDFLGTTNSTPLVFKTNNTTRFTLDATDNLILEQLKTNEKISAKKFKTFARYELYPNPAVNTINISSSKASEKLEVKILDVNGRLIIGKTVLISGYNTELNFNLLNGIYFVNLINEQGEKTIKKLVIAKE